MLGTKVRLVLNLLLALTLVSCLHQATPQLQSCGSSERADGCRPFRTGFVKFDPEWDTDKPLGAVDESGWSLAGTYLVGSPRPEWVAAHDLKNKKMMWWYHAKADLTAPIGVFGSWVVLALRDGRLVKLEASSGKLVWERPLGQFVSTRLSLAGSSLLAYSVDQKLFSVDFQTGQTQWVFDAGTPSGLLMRSASSPVASGAEVFLGNSDGELFSVSLSTGKENWRIELSGDDSRFRDIVGEIAVGNKQVYVARHDGLVYAYDTAQKPNEAIWKESFSSITSTAYRDGTYFVGCLNGDLIALQASNGRQLWKINLGQAVKSITLGDKSLFVGGSEGRITALNNTNGVMLWSDDVRGALSAQPIVIDDQIYFSTGLRVIYSYKIF